MEITNQNINISKRIVDMLANEKCTIRQACEILSHVEYTIKQTTTVDKKYIEYDFIP